MWMSAIVCDQPPGPTIRAARSAVVLAAWSQLHSAGTGQASADSTGSAAGLVLAPVPVRVGGSRSPRGAL